MNTVTVTRGELEQALRDVGWGDRLPRLVHCSMASLGQVIGGEQTVVEAMVRAAAGGAIIMPTQSWQLCDPAFLGWAEPGTDLYRRASEHRPIYSTTLTPSRSMGRVAELLRGVPGAARSPHPHRSFSGIGRGAADLLATHRLASPVGEGSPLSALYAARARVTLLGTDGSSCTALHLAEARAFGEERDTVENSTVVSPGNVVHWREQRVDSSDFREIVARFESVGDCRRVDVGAGTVVDLPLNDLVDYAVEHLPSWRSDQVLVPSS